MAETEMAVDAVELYAAHVESAMKWVADATEVATAEKETATGCLFASGELTYYHDDDLAHPFRSGHHFARFVPQPGPGHFLFARPGETPVLFRLKSNDFWLAPAPDLDPAYLDAFRVVDYTDRQTLLEEVKSAAGGDLTTVAFFGNDFETSDHLGVQYEPPVLAAALDWGRAVKTPYEIATLREAAVVAAHGVSELRGGFSARKSEHSLYLDYLGTTGQLPEAMPYSPIIGWDRAASVLHYQGRRTERPDPGNVLLVDAGVMVRGYASDITRTWCHSETPALFRALREKMHRLQRDLVSQVKPGVPFLELHVAAVRGITTVLTDVGVITVSPEDALDLGLGNSFFPHGLGHFLGIFTHDVGGRLANARGKLQAPPEEYPALRTTRKLEPGHVVTIEPGIYFIPMLLEKLRSGKHGDTIDWKLIDELTPCGGIRIEDDVLVTEEGFEDLTFEHLVAPEGSGLVP